MLGTETEMPKQRLLILDDDVSVGQTIAIIAEEAGLETRTTTDPDAFFRELSRWRPTHVGLDLVMPQMDGVEVMRLLAERECKARIIITSGLGGRVLDAARRSASEHGLDVAGVLSKPFLPAALRALLGESGCHPASRLAPPRAPSVRCEIDEDELRRALKRRDFQLAYQPKNLSQKCYRADNVFMSRLVVPISSERDALPTIWEVTDSMWENFFEPLILHLDPPFKMGRPRADQRKCLDGMIYRARTGCQWNQLPEKFGSDSTVHRTIQRWDSKGVFDAVWALLIYHCEELQAVNWEWQAVDGTLNKARFIGNGQKGGCKRASQMLGQPKSGRKTSREERRATRVKGSAPTQQIVRKWESREVFLSKETAIRFLS